MSFFTPPRTLRYMHLSELSNEQIATEIGRYTSHPEMQFYLDLTNNWDRFGEWLEWLQHAADTWEAPIDDDASRKLLLCLRIGAEASKAEFIDLPGYSAWPPSNIHLLGRASTQEELDEIISRLRDMRQRGWLPTLLLAPIEELHIGVWIDDAQIILEPPSSIVPPVLWCKSDWEANSQSIIAQVKQVRGECKRCDGIGCVCRTIGSCDSVAECKDCNGTGLNPTSPYLWDGQEWKEAA